MKKSLHLLFVLGILTLFVTGCSADKPAHIEIPIIETGVNTDSWALVPAGKFYKGEHNHETDINYDYEIMATDVTNAQYAQYLNEALQKSAVKVIDNKVMGYYPGDPFNGHKHEFEIEAGDWVYMPLDKPGGHILFDGDTFAVDKGFENHPVVMVTWFGAKGYCDFYGWRLPTENEWEKAARGTDTRPYSYGDEITIHDANYQLSNKELAKILGGTQLTTPVGFFNGKMYGDFQTNDAITPYGLYDMAGNVWQWTGDDYEDVHYRYMRGGSFMNYDNNLRVWARNNAGPEYCDINIGFRCVRNVEQNEENSSNEK